MKRLFLLLVIGLECASSIAQPYRPHNTEDVLETLPIRGQNWLEIRALRQISASHPTDIQQVLALVKRYIELGRVESDPRYYGYAEAALSPWLKMPNPMPEVLTLQATLYQNRHEFSSALALLDSALGLQPRMQQAWLTRAVIQEVQGNYPAALKSCQPLLRLSVPLIARVCISSVLSLTGELESAYQQLRQIVQLVPAEKVDKQWALTTLAEMAERKGDVINAALHYQEALAQAGRNGYLLATYADFLLDQQRFQEVIQLVRNEIRHDGLLLRLTLAEQELNLPQVQGHKDMLTTRFAASKLRGDTVHQGDEARFTLLLLKDPEKALVLAQKNWAVQREPRDSRILLQAAIASQKNLSAAQATLDFLVRTHLQDVRLETLRIQLKGVNS